MEFGQILREELKRQGKSQRWLANKMGVSPAAVTKYLNGNPSWDVIQKINSVLPLPKIADVFNKTEFLDRYLQKKSQFVIHDSRTKYNEDESFENQEKITFAYKDVLSDPDARAEFAELVEAILQLSPEQRRGLLQLIQGSDKPTK